MFGGNFKKFGTDSKGISGTFCAFALLCAKLGAAARSSPAASAPALRHLFIEASGDEGARNLYERLERFKFCSRDRCGRYARAQAEQRGTAPRRSTRDR